jgi:hypothetical protein
MLRSASPTRRQDPHGHDRVIENRQCDDGSYRSCASSQRDRPSTRRSERFAVYVVAEKAGRSFAHLRKVRLGDIVGNEIMVSSGVQLGDQVIVRGATVVTDGTEVQVIR